MVVFERLIARLLVVAPDRWIVKGGVALDFRMGGRARMTIDLDLANQGQIGLADIDMTAVQSVDLNDFFTFAIRTAPAFGPFPEHSTVRYRALAKLDDSKFEEFVVDVVFSDHPVPFPDLLTVPPLLEFAGVAPIRVPALPLEQHVAEKLHAYTQTYDGNRSNTRVKDLIDLVLIPSFSELNAARLHEAIELVFGDRQTQRTPRCLPDPPSAWDLPYQQLAREVDLDLDVRVGHQQAAAFLDPILHGNVGADHVWDSTA